VVSLLAFAHGDNCFDGDLYVFGFTGEVYQVNIATGDIEQALTVPNAYFQFGPTITQGKDGSILAAYSDTLITIADNHVTSETQYNSTTCPLSSLFYNPVTGKTWGAFTTLIWLNASYAVVQGELVTLETNSEGITNYNLRYNWTWFYMKKISEEQTTVYCSYYGNAYFGFYNDQKVYMNNGNRLVVVDISSDDATLVAKVVLPDYYSGMAMDSTKNLLYAVDLEADYIYTLDGTTFQNNTLAPWTYGQPLFSTMDSTNRYYVAFVSMYPGFNMIKFDTLSNTYSEITIDTSADLRNIASYSYTGCPSNASSEAAKKKKLVEIVVPIVLFVVFVAVVTGIIFFRRRHHHHYRVIN